MYISFDMIVQILLSFAWVITYAKPELNADLCIHILAIVYYAVRIILSLIFKR